MLNLILVLTGCKHHQVGFPMVGLYYYIGSHTILNQHHTLENQIFGDMHVFFFQFAECFISV